MLGAMWKPFEYLVFYQDVVLPTVLKKKITSNFVFYTNKLKAMVLFIPHNTSSLDTKLYRNAISSNNSTV